MIRLKHLQNHLPYNGHEKSPKAHPDGRCASPKIDCGLAQRGRTSLKLSLSWSNSERLCLKNKYICEI